MAAVMLEAAASGDANTGPPNVHMGPANVHATSKGRCRDCRTTQKNSGDGYEQCFSQHQDLPS